MLNQLEKLHTRNAELTGDEEVFWKRLKDTQLVAKKVKAFVSHFIIKIIASKEFELSFMNGV